MRSIVRHLVSYPGLVALSLSMLFAAQPGAVRAAESPRLTQVRFQLRADCECASCGFAVEGELRKQPGISRVSLSQRERTLTVSFDEQQVPLSRVAALVARTELGKRSALIGELTGPPATVDATDLSRVAGVREVTLDAKKKRLLVSLAEDPALTTAALTERLAKAGVVARFDSPAGKT